MSIEKIASHPDYLDALKFQEEFSPKPGVIYGWVQKYAEDQFARLVQTSRYLDEKADALIKYLGALTGLLTLGAIASKTPEKPDLFLYAVPAVVFAIVTIILSALARAPSAHTFPPDIRGAIRYADTYATAKDEFLGLWNTTCVGLRLSIDRKQRRVQWATISFCLTLVALLLGVLLAVYARWPR